MGKRYGRLMYMSTVTVCHRLSKNRRNQNFIFFVFVIKYLADRINGRAYATVLRPSVVVVFRRLWGYVLWLNGAS